MSFFHRFLKSTNSKFNRIFLLALLSINPAHAASLLLDSFDAPTPREFTVITTAGDFDTPGATGEIQTATPFVPGGIRETFLHVYNNPLHSASVLQVGEGNLSVAQETGAMAETLINYGAFTRPTGDPSVGGPLFRSRSSQHLLAGSSIKRWSPPGWALKNLSQSVVATITSRITPRQSGSCYSMSSQSFSVLFSAEKRNYEICQVRW